MPNHIHVSRINQQITILHSISYNRKHRTKHHYWEKNLRGRGKKKK